MAVQAITLGVEFLCRYRMQAKGGLLGASRDEHGHQNTAHRTETRLKRRHSATPVFNFVVLRTRVAVCCYSTLSREAVVMAWTVCAATNVIAPYDRILRVLQTCPFPQ
ncbi:uncharacterized protein TNCV_2775801 [Trichonephila clavipes]|nr:uncharacterized protein TNCV_2775801 [Trichonephila clavipes]